MPAHRHFALAVMCFVANVACAGEVAASAGTDGPTQCPFGHKSIKAVPILYGLLRHSDELQRQIDNLEVWRGVGCARDEKTKFVCTECRYAFEPLAQAWARFGENPQSFAVPLAELVAGFAKNKQLTSRLIYYQCVTDKKVLSESIAFWTTTDSTKEVVAACLRDRGVKITEPRGLVENPSLQFLTGSAGGDTIMVELHTSNLRRGEVYITMDAKFANKPIAPAATDKR